MDALDARAIWTALLGAGAARRARGPATSEKSRTVGASDERGEPNRIPANKPPKTNTNTKSKRNNFSASRDA